MSENSNSLDLIQQLLKNQEAEFYRANKAETLLQELSDVALLKSTYEKQLSEKDTAIEQKDKTIAEKDHTIAEKDKTIAEKDDRILSLERKLQYLERKVWGRMSERRIPDDPTQLKLDLNAEVLTPEEEAEVKQAAAEIKEKRPIKGKAPEKHVSVRQPLPQGLRHVECHLYPEGYLGHEDEWILFKETETSEHLEYRPAEFYVRVTIRHKGMRKDTKQITIPSPPIEPIAKSYATPSLLSNLIVGKYVDHLPFYRQIEIYKRLGVSLPPATIESWFHEVADLFRPLYYLVKDRVLACDYIQSDETTIPIINNEKHRTVKGYLWLVRDVLNGLIFFHYDEGSRSHKVALQLFNQYKGCIQTDGYSAYQTVAKLEGIIIMGCWAHTRRWFDRALDNDKARAEYALVQIGLLYDVERIATSENASPEKRQELRRRLAYPIICAFEKWCLAEKEKVLPKSPIGKAIGYFLNFARNLVRYTTDGRYLIDNNLIENSVRPVALGRKNYLFCGNHNAAEDAAVIYTMMGCCKIAAVDFSKWITYFLSHVHEYDGDDSKDLAELLPANLKASLS